MFLGGIRRQRQRTAILGDNPRIDVDERNIDSEGVLKPEFSDTLPSVVALSLVPGVSLLGASVACSTDPEFPWLGITGDLPISTILGGGRKNRYKDVMTIRRLQTRRDVDPFI